MNRWLVLLRAVNVGGTAKLPIEDLRTALESAGFENVKTYIASGNIVVDTSVDADAVATTVNRILNVQFAISGNRSIVINAVSLDRIIKKNPFADVALHRPNMLHVHFLSGPPQANAETNLTSFKGPERLRLDGQQLYIDYVNGAGTTALTGRFLETALGTNGTSRNWSTVLKLSEMFTDNS